MPMPVKIFIMAREGRETLALIEPAITNGLVISAISQRFNFLFSINTTIKHYAHLAESFRKEEIKKLEERMDTYIDT